MLILITKHAKLEDLQTSSMRIDPCEVQSSQAKHFNAFVWIKMFKNKIEYISMKFIFKSFRNLFAIFYIFKFNYLP
jgi:hypothetical protein